MRRTIDGKHVYEKDGVTYDSVTFFIDKIMKKPGLDNWKRNTRNWKEITNKARILGTLMHYRILNKISEFPIELPELDCISTWPIDTIEEIDYREAQWDSLGIEIKNAIVEKEVFFNNGDLRYAGTLDIKGSISVDGMSGRAIGDLKSSKRPVDSHRYQLGAYALADEENYDFGFLAYLRRDDAELVIIEKDELRTLGEEFIHMMAEYNSTK